MNKCNLFMRFLSVEAFCISGDMIFEKALLFVLYLLRIGVVIMFVCIK